MFNFGAMHNIVRNIYTYILYTAFLLFCFVMLLKDDLDRNGIKNKDFL